MAKDTTVKPDEKLNQEQSLPKDLTVKLYSPYKVYFNDLADTVSAVNRTGPFDILLGHHNFLTLLEQCEVVIRNKKNIQKFKISRGIMHVKKNKVTIFLDV